MKNYLTLAGAILLAGFMLVGCGRSGPADAQAFDQAAPELKAEWATALAADKSNDYFAAATAYGNIVKQESKLTPKQFTAAESASRALMQRVMDASNSGDAAAKQALARLMAAQVR